MKLQFWVNLSFGYSMEQEQNQSCRALRHEAFESIIDEQDMAHLTNKSNLYKHHILVLEILIQDANT